MKSTSPTKNSTFSDPAQQAAFDALPEIDNPQKSELSLFEIVHIWASLDSQLAGLAIGSMESDRKFAAAESLNKKCREDFGITAMQAYNSMPKEHQHFIANFPHGA